MKVDLSDYTMVEPTSDGFYSIKTFAENNISVRPSTLKNKAYAGWVGTYVKDKTLKKGSSNEWVKIRVLELFVEAATMETRTSSTESKGTSAGMSSEDRNWFQRLFDGLREDFGHRIETVMTVVKTGRQEHDKLKERVDRIQSGFADLDKSTDDRVNQLWDAIRILQEEIDNRRGR